MNRIKGNLILSVILIILLSIIFIITSRINKAEMIGEQKYQGIENICLGKIESTV